MIRHILMDEKLPMSYQMAPLPEQPVDNVNQLAKLVWDRAVIETKREGDHAPMGIFKSEGTFVIVGMDFRPELKDQIVTRLHQAAKDFKAQAFAMVMTVWYLDDPSLVNQCVDHDLRPAQHIKRKEGLLVEAQGQTGEEIIIGDIIRGPGENVVEITLKDRMHNVQAQSRFAGIITRGSA